MEQAAARDPLIGVTVGNYEVKTKLGEGGMGAVYLAEHPLIGKKVALKVLHSEFSSNPEVAGRFFDEARAVTDIKHPNIVDISDYGVIPNNGEQTVYFIMEYLDGQSLAQLVRTEAPVEPERALAIAFQVADALNASHGRGIIHRDLKPDNVMLIQHGRERDFVKVLDFGIAKLSTAPEGSRRTRMGVILGTPQYMAPEQCDGHGHIDHRADIYALGILLYEMLTGRPPFNGQTFQQILVQQLTQAPIRPSSLTHVIPPHVEVVILKALAKNPDARFPTMEEFMKALADPVGYVERHGGVAAFASTPIAPSATVPPLSPGAQSPHTPAPGQIFTPGAGYIPSYPPGTAPGTSPGMAPGTSPGMAPGTSPGMGPGTSSGMGPGTAPGMGPGTAPGMGPGTAPGTLPGTGEFLQQEGSGTRIGIVVAVVVLVLALGLGAYVFLGPGDGSEEVAENTPENAIDDPIEGQTGTTPDEPDLDTRPDTAPDTPPTGDGAGDEQVGREPGGGDTTDAVETPPEPARVAIHVISNPPGASVYLGDEKQPRGTTPFKFELEKSSDKVAMRLELENHKPYKRTFKPNNNKEFDLQLKPRRRSRRDRDTGKDKDRGHGDKDPAVKHDSPKDKDKDTGDDKNKYDEDVGLVPLEG